MSESFKTRLARSTTVIVVASTRSIVDYLLEQLGPTATARSMFGEYGVYLSGTLIGQVCDNRFFLKVTDAGSRVIGEHERDSPYPGAKPAIVVPEELWEERALLRRLAAATADALGSPRPVGTRTTRRRRRPSPQRGS
jgi:TfoX/Sxy family transcriptional regulator of competence genes